MKPRWERLDDESNEAFTAFITYRDLGRERSIEAAFRKNYEKPTQHKRKPDAKRQTDGTWTKWSRKFEWLDRARAYDDHLDRIELESRATERAKVAAKLEARRLEQREREWTLGQKLQAKAEQLIGEDLEAKTGDSARLATAGAKLARLSVGMETEHQKVTGSGSGIQEIDLSDKDDDQLRAYLGGLADVAARLASGG